MRHIYKGQFAPMDKNVIWIKGDKMYLWGPNGWEEVTENTRVDQEFDSDSTHAVSGKAIADNTVGKEGIDDIYKDTEYYKRQYFTIENVSFIMPNYAVADWVSIDGGDWVRLTPDNFGQGTTINAKVMRFKGFGGQYRLPNMWVSKIKVYGNIMSLFLGDDFYREDYEITGRRNLEESALNMYTSTNIYRQAVELFQYVTGPQIDAENLIIPCAYAYGMWANFFAGTQLIKAPKLLFTKVGENSCSGMFKNCTLLEEAPEMNVTSLDKGCFASMFEGCTSLKKSPNLPAEILKENCYKDMFKGCSALNEITCGAVLITASNCTNGWTNGVASTGVFNRGENGTNEWETGSNGIPEGWTSVPEIVDYKSMPLTLEMTSAGGIKVSTASSSVNVVIKKNGEKVSSGDYVAVDTTGYTMSDLVSGDKITLQVYSADSYATSPTNLRIAETSGTFNVYGNIMSLAYGDDRFKTAVTVGNGQFTSLFAGRNSYGSGIVDASNLKLPATTVGSTGYKGMFSYMRGMQFAPKTLPAQLTASDTEAYAQMFSRCPILESPILASSLVPASGYDSMFNSCGNLIKITCLATDISATNALNNWVNGAGQYVSQEKTFAKIKATKFPSGNSGIPNGWKVINL